MTLKEFMRRYRVEAVATIVGWGAEVHYTLFDKTKNERVHYQDDVYGEFLRFPTVEAAMQWAEDNKDE